jgi:hypothetical protein
LTCPVLSGWAGFVFVVDIPVAIICEIFACVYRLSEAGSRPPPPASRISTYCNIQYCNIAILKYRRSLVRCALGALGSFVLVTPWQGSIQVRSD